MIKVLHILESANPGGISNLVLDLILTQKTNTQLSLGLLLCRGEGILRDRIHTIGIPVYTSSIKGGYDLSLRKYLFVLKIFRKQQIIHFHSYNHFLFLLAILSSRKIVYTIHSLHLAPGRSVKFSDFFKAIIFKLFFRHFVHHLTFNSKYTEQYTVSTYHLLKKNYSLIYNGVIFNKFKVPTSNEKNDIFTIGIVASLVKLKRVDWLINSFITANLNSSQLIIVGDGPERQWLEQLVQSKGKENQVLFTGYQAELSPYFSKFNILVSTSVSETFGLVAIEAMYYGIPVIAMTDGGGITEIVETIEPGNIVSDQDELIEKIRYFYANQLEIEEKRLVRLNYALTFSMDQMESSFFTVYRSFF
jgi:L-malate glycosyltransferase